MVKKKKQNLGGIEYVFKGKVTLGLDWVWEEVEMEYILATGKVLKKTPQMHGEKNVFEQWWEGICRQDMLVCQKGKQGGGQ